LRKKTQKSWLIEPGHGEAKQKMRYCKKPHARRVKRIETLSYKYPGKKKSTKKDQKSPAKELTSDMKKGSKRGGEKPRLCCFWRDAESQKPKEIEIILKSGVPWGLEAKRKVTTRLNPERGGQVIFSKVGSKEKKFNVGMSV